MRAYQIPAGTPRVPPAFILGAGCCISEPGTDTAGSFFIFIEAPMLEAQVCGV